MNMITILAIVFCWFLVVKAIKGAVAHSRQKQAARAEAAMNREIDRLNRLMGDGVAERERIRQDVLRHDLEIVKIQKMERKLAEEQARQAAVLARHEEDIRKLNFTVAQFVEDIDYLKEHIGNLYALRDIAMNELEQAIVGGRNHSKYQKQVISLDKQIHTAEMKLSKAQFNLGEAKHKLEEKAAA